MSKYIGQRVQRASEKKLVCIVRVVTFEDPSGWVVLETGCGRPIKHHPTKHPRFLEKFSNCLLCLAG